MAASELKWTVLERSVDWAADTGVKATNLNPPRFTPANQLSDMDVKLGHYGPASEEAVVSESELEL